MPNKTTQYEDEQNNQHLYLLDIADSYYWNARQRIIRVKHPERAGGFIDLYLGQSMEVPNPSNHLIIAIMDDKLLRSTGVDEDKFSLSPGLKNKDGELDVIPSAIAFLINKQQKISISDPQNGSAGFSLSNTNMFDDNKIRLAISPSIAKDYTNNKQNENDRNEIGIFMNEDAILARSRGGSITLADEGIHFGGNIFWEHTKHSKEIMMDNPLHGLIPQTIPTAIISIPLIPNFAMLTQVANGAIKFIEVVDKLKQVSKILG